MAVKHGLVGTPEYRIWGGIKTRCLNAKDHSYQQYGLHGIKICKRWRISVAAFVGDMGKRPTPKHTIDRIDNKGHYSCGQCAECRLNNWPMNCRWATDYQQKRNMSNNNWLEYDNRRMILTDWAAEYKISGPALHQRLQRGWEIKEALETPIRQDDKTRRDNVWIKYNGQNRIASDWAKEIGVHVGVILMRLKRGWGIERALTTPKMR